VTNRTPNPKGGAGGDSTSGGRGGMLGGVGGGGRRIRDARAFDGAAGEVHAFT